MNRNVCLRLLGCVIAALPVSVLGCGGGASGYNDSVEGVVTLDGQPLGNVVVSFVPNGPGEAQPPVSTARTDEQGRFKLQCKRNGSTDEPGAVLGTHVVLVTEQPAERKTRSDDSAAPGPTASKKRVPARYGFPGTTPLTVAVTAEKHDYPLSLTSR
jgi:hypothetical protein